MAVDESRKKNALRIGAGVAMLAALAGLVWVFMPGDLSARSRPDVVATLDGPSEAPRKRVVQMASFEQEVPEHIPLEEDPDIPVVTPKCKSLVEQERRHVPQYTLLDSIRDQAMRFTEEDLGCLTAAGISPAILDIAEMNISYNALRGIKGTPGKDMTKEHWTYLEHPSHPDNQKKR